MSLTVWGGEVTGRESQSLTGRWRGRHNPSKVGGWWLVLPSTARTSSQQRALLVGNGFGAGICQTEKREETEEIACIKAPSDIIRFLFWKNYLALVNRFRKSWSGKCEQVRHVVERAPLEQLGLLPSGTCLATHSSDVCLWTRLLTSLPSVPLGWESLINWFQRYSSYAHSIILTLSTSLNYVLYHIYALSFFHVSTFYSLQKYFPRSIFWPSCPCEGDGSTAALDALVQPVAVNIISMLTASKFVSAALTFLLKPRRREPTACCSPPREHLIGVSNLIRPTPDFWFFPQANFSFWLLHSSK